MGRYSDNVGSYGFSHLTMMSCVFSHHSRQHLLGILRPGIPSPRPAGPSLFLTARVPDAIIPPVNGEKGACMTAAFLLALTVASGSGASPLLETEDALDRGATCLYTVSLVEGMSYWVVLEPLEDGADFDVVVASSDMDLERFMNLPYYEDYLLAREHAIAEGVDRGGESFTLHAPYTGSAHVVVHDIGETGGSYSLRIY